MNQLHERFLSVLLEQLQSNKFKAAFIREKLEEAGFKVTDNTLEEIEQKLGNLTGDGITIESIGVDSDGKIQNFSLDLNKPGEIEEFATNILQKSASELIPQLAESISKTLLKDLKRGAPAMLEGRRKRQNDFETTLNRTWGHAIDMLEVFIVTATESGDDFNNEFKDKADKTKNWVFFCLARLHARACQITSEILTLLKSGYADGALARWRVLYETTVMALFIQKHGASTAEQYFHYDRIEAVKAVEEYNIHYVKLKLRPISKRELAQLERTRIRLVAKYGLPYGVGNYGWAASALGKKKVDYKDIEGDVGVSHLRPYYKQASANIHATPKGLFFSLGTATSNILPTGPSIFGLMSPGQLTAISLLQITTSFLQLQLNVDRVVMCHVLTKLEKEVGLAFGMVQ
ncbi:hypothetical protein GCM10028808_13240 [Spirosoma migulaei]